MSAGLRKLPGTMADLAKRVRDLRNSLGLKQGPFAVLVGVSQPTVSRWESGEDDPEEENLVQLARLARATVAEFKYGQGALEGGALVVPVVGSIGDGEKVNDAQGGTNTDLERVALPPELEADGLVALRVTGNSLRPLRAGWLLYYRQADGIPDDAINEMCIVELADGQRLIKELRRGGTADRYTLLSWSANADPLEDQDVRRASRILDIRPGRP